MSSSRISSMFASSLALGGGQETAALCTDRRSPLRLDHLGALILRGSSRGDLRSAGGPWSGDHGPAPCGDHGPAPCGDHGPAPCGGPRPSAEGQSFFLLPPNILTANGLLEPPLL